MIFLDRFLRMLADPYVDEVRVLWAEDVTRKQREAYQVGVAHGQILGQRQMLVELERQVDLRHRTFPEVTAEDITRAKKGLVH